MLLPFQWHTYTHLSTTFCTLFICRSIVLNQAWLSKLTSLYFNPNLLQVKELKRILEKWQSSLFRWDLLPVEIGALAYLWNVELNHRQPHADEFGYSFYDLAMQTCVFECSFEMFEVLLYTDIPYFTPTCSFMTECCVVAVLKPLSHFWKRNHTIMANRPGR